MTGYKLHVEWWTYVEHLLDLPAFRTLSSSSQWLAVCTINMQVRL